ncbi:MAG TPA: hypothetical protein VFS67_30655 [Polyangiaceae bacterium]|nr:hypothetical protein [Polyangiaceae bacterium]
MRGVTGAGRTREGGSSGVSRYLDPSTVEYCEHCRCKTWHLLDAQTGERACEWLERHILQSTPATPQPQPAEARP